ncbi:DUF58 domain-containing protein [archaeon]|nr:DUF58 domain-containing protein [archaeon]
MQLPKITLPEGKSEVELPVNQFSFDDLVRRLDVDARTLIDIFGLKMIYLMLLTGKGLEFDRLREYTASEDATSIDWNATARMAKPYIKVFDEERMLDVILAVDVSNTMLLGTTEMVKTQYAALVAGVMAFVGVNSGDKVGLLLFSDKVTAFVEPSSTMDDYYTKIKIITDKKHYGGKKNWSCVPKAVLSSFGPDTVLFIISDFIGMGNKEFAGDLSKFTTKFKKVFGIMVRDPRDSYLPEGVGSVYLADPNTGEVNLVNVDSIREKYAEAALKEEMAVQKAFQNTGQEFFKIYTNEDFITAFTNYFELVAL